jgi:hypothetical protein
MSGDDTAASQHGADAETTAVPPPPADAPELAWSVDDDTDESQPNRHGRLMWAALAALVVAVTAALVLLASTFFAHRHANTATPRPIPPPPPPPVTSTVAAAPAPPTVTPPPARQPTPALTFTDEQDQRMLSQLTAQDYTITDAAEVVQHAHRYCTLVQQGIPAMHDKPLRQRLFQPNRLGMRLALKAAASTLTRSPEQTTLGSTYQGTQ